MNEVERARNLEEVMRYVVHYLEQHPGEVPAKTACIARGLLQAGLDNRFPINLNNLTSYCEEGPSGD